MVEVKKSQTYYALCKVLFNLVGANNKKLIKTCDLEE